MNPILAELIGTALLILFGNGVVANVVLNRTKGNNAGWITITAGWGMAVFVGAFCTAESSGAHLNPAVSVAMLVAGKLSLMETISYIAAQFIGAAIGSMLVYIHYHEHFNVTEDANAKLACFCTGAEIRNNFQSFVCEIIGTFALILPIFLIANPSLSLVEGAATAPKLGLGALGLLPVGLLVFAIGVSLGGTTGYAINPARDFAPRLMHSMLPIANKRDSDWGYAWVPVVGPIVGAVLAAWVFRAVS